MGTCSVTRKGQVTIPQSVRRKQGIRQGSTLEFALVSDHIELRVKSMPVAVPKSGFGLLESRRKAVPVDFDPATLAKP